MNINRHVAVAIIGAGSAGLYATPTVRDATDGNFVLINGGAHGTTSVRSGCMPSKTLLQVAEDFHRRHYFAQTGILGTENLQVNIPEVLRHVRDLRDRFIARVLSGLLKIPEANRINGYARFVEPNVLEVNDEYIRADKIIIATGSSPVLPTAWEGFQDYILTTDELFEQDDLPSDMAIVGLGPVGLEIGQALSRLGVRITGFDLEDDIGGISDPVVQKAAGELLIDEFHYWLGKDTKIEIQGDWLRIHSGNTSALVKKLLITAGRRPNLDYLGLENLSLEWDEAGLPLFDPNTLQLGDYPIFLAGDATGESMTMHEAGDEGRIVAYNATHEVQSFPRRIPLSIIFTDPNIAQIGMRWEDIQTRDDVVVGELNFQRQSRAVLMSHDKGIMRVYADKNRGGILGASLAIPRGEHIAHLLAWAVEQELTVFDLLKMPYYHPTIEEGLQTVLQSLRWQIKNADKNNDNTTAIESDENSGAAIVQSEEVVDIADVAQVDNLVSEEEVNISEQAPQELEMTDDTSSNQTEDVDTDTAHNDTCLEVADIEQMTEIDGINGTEEVTELFDESEQDGEPLETEEQWDGQYASDDTSPDDMEEIEAEATDEAEWDDAPEAEEQWDAQYDSDEVTSEDMEEIEAETDSEEEWDVQDSADETAAYNNEDIDAEISDEYVMDDSIEIEPGDETDITCTDSDDTNELDEALYPPQDSIEAIDNDVLPSDDMFSETDLDENFTSEDDLSDVDPLEVLAEEVLDNDENDEDIDDDTFSLTDNPEQDETVAWGEEAWSQERWAKQPPAKRRVG